MQAVTNLSEVLDLTGRTEEALAEVERRAWRCCARNPERTSYDTFMELQGVNLLIKLGRLGELEPGLPAPKFGDAVGTTPIFLAELRAPAGAADRRRCAAARRQLEELRRLCLGTLDPQWMEPLHALRRSSRCSRTARATRATRSRRGLASLDGVRGRRADRAAGVDRPDGRGDRGRAGAGARRAGLRGRRASGCSPSSRRRAQMPGRWADAPAYEALALRRGRPAARRARRRGARPGRAGSAAVEAFAALEQPWPAAYAGFRAAEAHVQAGDRAAAAAPLRAARERAAAMGAAPLLGEIDALARRARLDARRAGRRRRPSRGRRSRPPTSSASPRASSRCCCSSPPGRTNREIGAELFMSEKTASVHVSRILAKLGVGGRVEAAAVAHRLGLTEPAASV